MERGHLTSKIVNYFLDSKLTPILIFVTLALGIFAIIKTPKDEEPQIVVPMIDIFIQFPGAEPEEIEKRIVTPLEKKLWELKDIEYIYSVSKPGMAVVTARFYVGTDPVKALVDLNSKWMSALDLAPPGVILPPLIKPKSIDDVPILTLTLWGENYDSYALRKMANLLENEIKKIENVAEVNLVGGLPRVLRVILDPVKLEMYRLSPLVIEKILKNANAQCIGGKVKERNLEYIVQTGEFLRSKEDVENILVGVFQGKPIYLREVANIVDGPSEIQNYVFMGIGPSKEFKGIKDTKMDLYPAVTIAISKRKGTNAVKVAEEILQIVSQIKATMLPSDLHITITRNYGETAKEKANELLEHLFIATFAVILLIAISLGWKEAFIVGIAVPVTLSMALFLSMLYGFTLNRVTLFALIFCIGILVDDPIVDVENINRWFKANIVSNPRLAILGAINEVRAPIILATFTVIAALMPMAFVTGLMGPYMRPIPINASVAMIFSLLVALTITPWAAYRILVRDMPSSGDNDKDQEILSKLNELDKREIEEEFTHIKRSKFFRIFAKAMLPFLVSKKNRYWLYGGTILLLLISFSLFYFKVVLVKMLPYDNKSEVQVVLDMPEGTPLEKTLEVANAIANYVKREKIVTDYQIYVGTNAPYNFNGLVRHYYLRSEPHQAEIQINLVGKKEREESSHEFAKRIRPKIHEIAKSYGAKYVAVVEVPPGPPVLSPIVAEVYAKDLESQEKMARKVLEIFRTSPLITDEGMYLEEPQPRIMLIAKEDKLKWLGLNKEELVETIKLLFGGKEVGLLHTTDTEQVPLLLKLDEKFRNLDRLRNLKITNTEGNVIPLAEIAEIKEDTLPRNIYHKNLRRVVYVIGDTAGKFEAPVYGIFDVRDKIKTQLAGEIKEYWLSHPIIEEGFAIKWDGEMHITLEVFRDLGLAFIGAIFVMYVLILIWFKDWKIPGVIMAPIPLTLLGIIPGHFILKAFFTATSMIGFIALSGIIVRNSILVVDFAEKRVNKGVYLPLAVVESAVVRARPIMLTATGIIVGAFVILFDPIFNGLAISLIFGTIGPTLLSIFLIPILYYGHKLKKEKVTFREEEIKQELFD